MRALGLLLLATAIAAAAAVPCSNFATEAECNASATSSGQCGWQGGACVVVAPLPPGMAGIATVGPEEEVVPVGAPAAADAPAPAPESPSDFCTLPAETGPCRAAIPAYYFDASAGGCQPFLYGGCQGNSNRFETLEACATAAAAYCVGAPSAAPVDLAEAPAAAQADAVRQPTGGSTAARAGAALAALAAAAAALVLA